LTLGLSTFEALSVQARTPCRYHAHHAARSESTLAHPNICWISHHARSTRTIAHSLMLHAVSKILQPFLHTHAPHSARTLARRHSTAPYRQARQIRLARRTRKCSAWGSSMPGACIIPGEAHGVVRVRPPSRNTRRPQQISVCNQPVSQSVSQSSQCTRVTETVMPTCQWRGWRGSHKKKETVSQWSVRQ
jgi:hypothetical protein